MENQNKQAEKLKSLEAKPFNDKVKESIKQKQEYVNKPIKK